MTAAEAVRSVDRAAAEQVVRAKIASDDRWLERALLAIHSKQTAHERAVQATEEDNGVGFNGADAQLLSSFAERLRERGRLSPKQTGIARRRLQKYAAQLVKIARGEA